MIDQDKVHMLLTIVVGKVSGKESCGVCRGVRQAGVHDLGHGDRTCKLGHHVDVSVAASGVQGGVAPAIPRYG